MGLQTFQRVGQELRERDVQEAVGGGNVPSFVHSANNYRAYCVPGTALGAQDVVMNSKTPALVELMSQGEGKTINK